MKLCSAGSGTDKLTNGIEWDGMKLRCVSEVVFKTSGLCLREALAVCTPPAPEPSAERPGSYKSMNSLGKNTDAGSLSLLQGIFPTQGPNPGLPHCRWILYQLSHKGSPRILECTTERLHFHFSLSCIGEGNGNPLQCSCLKNPRA